MTDENMSSAVAHPVRNKMFGFFKNILRKQTGSAPVEEQFSAEEQSPVEEPLPLDEEQAAEEFHSAPPPMSKRSPRQNPGNSHLQNGRRNGNGRSTGVELPLEPIFKNL